MLRTRTATSPDGREWRISVQRVRLPRWPESQYDPADEDVFVGLLSYLVLAPIFWLVVPLARVLAELPVALVRPLFSSTAWVEAVCREPSEIRIVWRTSRKRAAEVADHVARRLPHGYGELTPAGAVRESMTAPPGFSDLDD